MSAWWYVAGAAGMAAVGMAAVVAFTPKRQPGRHIPHPVPPREEAGADATYAVELAVMAAEIAEQAPEPTCTRTGEYPLVKRPEGDTDAWLVQEKVADEEPPVASEGEVAPPAPEVPSWMTQTALEGEPTPLAPGPVPELDFESFTNSWKRADLRRRLGMEPEEQAA